jgi:hypothetical protein
MCQNNPVHEYPYPYPLDIATARILQWQIRVMVIFHQQINSITAEPTIKSYRLNAIMKRLVHVPCQKHHTP